MKNIIPFILLLTAFSMNYAKAQQNVILVTGDYYSGENASLSWSVGETVCETFSNGNYMLTQGFQQPETILDTNNIVTSEVTSVRLYPNPATSYFMIDINAKDYNSEMVIYDIQGKIITRGNLNTNLTRYGIDNYKPGVYLVTISNHNETFTTYLLKN